MHTPVCTHVWAHALAVSVSSCDLAAPSLSVEPTFWRCLSLFSKRTPKAGSGGA